MNVAFAFYDKKHHSILIQCPKCHTTEDANSGVVDTLYFADDTVETRAGIEGVEAQVMV